MGTSSVRESDFESDSASKSDVDDSQPSSEEYSTTNLDKILQGEQWESKILDFGAKRLSPEAEDHSSLK